MNIISAKKRRTDRDFAVLLHYADFNVLCTSLYNLQKTLDGEFDALLAREVIFVVLFEEFAHGL